MKPSKKKKHSKRSDRITGSHLSVVAESETSSSSPHTSKLSVGTSSSVEGTASVDKVEDRVTASLAEVVEVEEDVPEKELDVVLADRRRRPTPIDDAVYYLRQALVQEIVDSYECAPAMRRVLPPRPGLEPAPTDVDPIAETLRADRQRRAQLRQQHLRSPSTTSKMKRGSGPKDRRAESLGMMTSRSSVMEVDITSSKHDGHPGSMRAETASRSNVHKSRPSSSSIHKSERPSTSSIHKSEQPSTSSVHKSEKPSNIHIQNSEQHVDQERPTPTVHDEVIDDTACRCKHDLLVNAVYKDGSRYSGRVSRHLFEGRGKYTWADGASYKGDFVGGSMTGRGRIEWAELTWYEGDVVCGWRHGRGMCVIPGGTCYSGAWHWGRKHGHGVCYYSDRGDDWYEGEWSDDQYNGYGIRQYATGGRYQGDWLAGRRHGVGVMVWPNNHFYRGEWYDGQFHGYGEYTRLAFLNMGLSVPQESAHRGAFCRGRPHGKGVADLATGEKFYTTWVAGIKQGPGKLMCTNGKTLCADPLFFNNRLLLPSDHGDGPIFSADHNIDLTHHIARLDLLVRPRIDKMCQTAKIVKEESMQSLPQEAEDSPQERDIAMDMPSPRHQTKSTQTVFTMLSEESAAMEMPGPGGYEQMLMSGICEVQLCREEVELKSMSVSDSSLHRVTHGVDVIRSRWEERESREVILTIMRNLPTLRRTYKHYALAGGDENVAHEPLLTRMFLWQLYRDCGFHTRGVTLVQLDEMLAKNPYSEVQFVHAPFEPLLFWQFLHSLLDAAWLLYIVRDKGNLECALAHGLDTLVVRDLAPLQDTPITSTMLSLHQDLLPLDSIHHLYTSLGRPVLARDFLRFACSSPAPSSGPIQVPPDGFNACAVGGSLTFLPARRPLVGVARDKQAMDVIGLKNVGARRVVNVLVQVCPGIMEEGLIVNMDYPLTFLEFHEALLLCAALSVKADERKEAARIREEEKRKEAERIREEEKRKEAALSMEADERKEAARKASIHKKQGARLTASLMSNKSALSSRSKSGAGQTSRTDGK